YSIYRMRADGSQQERLVENAAFLTLSPDEEWIYYRLNTDSMTLYRMRIDSSEKQPLTQVEDTVGVLGWVPGLDLPFNAMTPFSGGVVMLLGGMFSRRFTRRRF